MGTAGNCAFPGHVKGLQAEWAAARPFVIALRTGAENKLLTAQEFVVCSERNQKAAFSVFADQKFFQAGNPLANRPFASDEKRRGQFRI
jgi:hypothetical protein